MGSQKKADSPKVLIQKLTREINRHNRLYYQEARPEISDAEYDRRYKELETLEKEYPELATADSPTHKVGGQAAQGFKTVFSSRSHA